MKKRLVKVDLDEGSSRIWNGESFAGTTVLYGAKDDDAFGMQCDYELSTLTEVSPEEVRAFRESRRRGGGKVKKLPNNRIRDELVVIFGPDMSAKSAVTTLKHLVKKIEEEGLLIGRDQADEYVVESVGGALSS
ncbi:hypothetical protein IVB33_11045 [Bradyrhizobium sp. 24]|uniref:hypothetical protein n=1 Tax=unclassified Bradyrhizobium TaxID=2631580 RepID=UPI001FF94107|nr:MULTISPECIES: hypothetical protein [unclassified Bradyrhizobium]MCK1301959.1 hypothetical protein [Bradyrhizobium sp. 37]MCK1378561.1 hypothetical protein [Bradyrhizobium sp. 24]MCK1773460.1 hypothetical protein [Bradyrhizobium sp. 134]